MKTHKNTYGNRLRELRARKGITIDSAANTCGIHRMSWWKLEKNLRSPSMLTAAAIKKEFGVDHPILKAR